MCWPNELVVWDVVSTAEMLLGNIMFQLGEFETAIIAVL